MVKDQSSKSPAEIAAFTVDDVGSKIAALDREIKYLLNKAKIWKPKKPKEPKTETNTTKASNNTQEEDGPTIDSPEGGDTSDTGNSNTDIPEQTGNSPGIPSVISTETYYGGSSSTL